MIRFLLDEMLSPVIAAMARRAGVDVESIQEQQSRGAIDQDVLLMAARTGRCVITVNHRHFVPLTRRFFEQGLPHAGVALVPGSVSTNAYASIANAIIRFARENPDGLQAYEVRWLSVDPE